MSCCGCLPCCTLSKCSFVKIGYLHVLFTLCRTKTEFNFGVTSAGTQSYNWRHFLFLVKATALKQQMSKFRPLILSTEVSYHLNIPPHLNHVVCLRNVCAQKKCRVQANCHVKLKHSKTGEKILVL